MRKKWVTILSVLTVFIFGATVAFAAMGIRNITTSSGTVTKVTPRPSALAASASVSRSASASADTSASAPLPACPVPSPVRLRICATLSGAGNNTTDNPVIVTASVTGLVTSVCTNKGGNVAPGQNIVETTVEAMGSFQSDANGNVNVDLVTGVPTISAKQAGCPGANWTVIPTSVEFVSFTFVVTQNGVEVIRNFYTIN